MPTTEAATGPLELTDALIAEVRDALAHGNPVLAAALAEPLHAADLAGLLERLNGGERAELVLALGTGFDPDTLAYLDEFVRDQVIEALGPQATGEALGQLETDDAVEILAELDAAEQKAILESVPLLERAAIEQALAYPEYSAGRLMQREAVAVPEHWSVGQTVDYLRAHRRSAGGFLRHLPGRPALQGRGRRAAQPSAAQRALGRHDRTQVQGAAHLPGRGRPGGGGARLPPLRAGFGPGGRRRTAACSV